MKRDSEAAANSPAVFFQNRLGVFLLDVSILLEREESAEKVVS